MRIHGPAVHARPSAALTVDITRGHSQPGNMQRVRAKGSTVVQYSICSIPRTPIALPYFTLVSGALTIREGRTGTGSRLGHEDGANVDPESTQRGILCFDVDRR